MMKFKMGDRVRLHRDWVNKRDFIEGTIIDVDVNSFGRCNGGYKISVNGETMHYYRGKMDFLELVENGLQVLAKINDRESNI